MARHRSWRRGTGRMIGYRLLIIKESGKPYGRIGLWRKGKIRIFVEGKLQKTWANTWIQESRMCVVKKTGYPQHHHHVLQFVTIFTDFAKGRILVFMWSESLNSAHLFELTTHSWVGLTQVLILRISLQTGDRGKDLDFLATHNLGVYHLPLFSPAASEWSPGDVEERNLVGKINRP